MTVFLRVQCDNLAINNGIVGHRIQRLHLGRVAAVEIVVVARAKIYLAAGFDR